MPEELSVTSSTVVPGSNRGDVHGRHPTGEGNAAAGAAVTLGRVSRSGAVGRLVGEERDAFQARVCGIEGVGLVERSDGDLEHDAGPWRRGRRTTGRTLVRCRLRTRCGRRRARRGRRQTERRSRRRARTGCASCGRGRGGGCCSSHSDARGGAEHAEELSVTSSTVASGSKRVTLTVATPPVKFTLLPVLQSPWAG